MDEDFDIPAANEMMDEDMGLPDDPPILKVGEEKEIGNQGLKKKLLKEAEGWDTPDNGDEVEGNFIDVFIIIFYFYILCMINSVLYCAMQSITLELCWMVASLIPVVIGARLSSSLLVKVRDEIPFIV